MDTARRRLEASSSSLLAPLQPVSTSVDHANDSRLGY